MTISDTHEWGGQGFLASCLSNFSLVSILLAVSTACLRSFIGNSVQYNFVESMFLNTSKICDSL